jgi:hypothetical protein
VISNFNEFQKTKLGGVDKTFGDFNQQMKVTRESLSNPEHH